MTELRNDPGMEALQLHEKIKKYFVHSAIACPYGVPYEAVYNQACFDTMPDFLMAAYLASGYRRNGNIIYNMACRDCYACVPIRIDPRFFKLNRSQKRSWRRNQDIHVSMGPLSCSSENLDLLEKFLAARYPDRDSSALDYYNGFFLNHITNTVEVSYRINSKLIGTAIIDLSFSWLNVVFFYFDPAEKKRSPGTFNILYLIDFCRHKEIDFVYLGYWIREVKQMSYKANFKPHSILRDNTWQLVTRQ